MTMTSKQIERLTNVEVNLQAVQEDCATNNRVTVSLINKVDDAWQGAKGAQASVKQLEGEMADMIVEYDKQFEQVLSVNAGTESKFDILKNKVEDLSRQLDTTRQEMDRRSTNTVKRFELAEKSIHELRSLAAFQGHLMEGTVKVKEFTQLWQHERDHEKVASKECEELPVAVLGLLWDTLNRKTVADYNDIAFVKWVLGKLSPEASKKARDSKDFANWVKLNLFQLDLDFKAK